MRNIRAIFFKQSQSLIKSPGMIIQAVLFMALILVMSFLISDDGPIDCDSCIPKYVCAYCLENGGAPLNTPNPSLTGLFTVMFVGFAVVGTASALVIEDKTTQNFRFMKMADVKPKHYLLGTLASMSIITLVLLFLYAVVGGYFGANMLWFMGAAMAGALVSILLGLLVGMSRAPGLTTVFSLVLGLGPMLSSFNEALARLLWFTYTQQVNIALSDLSDGVTTGFGTNFMVIGANGVVILLMFIWMHRKGTLS